MRCRVGKQKHKSKPPRTPKPAHSLRQYAYVGVTPLPSVRIDLHPPAVNSAADGARLVQFVLELGLFVLSVQLTFSLLHSMQK